MYDRILVPLDGSQFAEEIVPYALGFARSMGARLTLLHVAKHDSDVAAAEEYMQPLARRLGAEGKVVVAHTDTGKVILEELSQHPRTLVTMTTHGHTALLEAILGSVALSVVHDAGQPVLIYRPRGTLRSGAVDKEMKIASVMAPLDGSKFSECMLPHAARMALSLGAKLTLVQVLPPEVKEPPEVSSGDILESSYLHARAEETKREYEIEADWEVLHGDPADAICEYLNGQHDVMLAMSSHTRGGLRETVFGSVTHECVRRAGVPVLVYRPENQTPRPT